MRGAGTHSIQQTAVEFPQASPSIASIDNAVSSSAASNHQIGEDRTVDFDEEMEESEVALSILGEPPITSPAGPSMGLARRQERMRGAGTHMIEAKPVPFASPEETSLANSSSLDDSRSMLQDVSMPEPKIARLIRQSPRRLGKDQRQRRMRGAGTHIIDPQHVPFPSPADNSLSTSALPSSLSREVVSRAVSESSDAISKGMLVNEDAQAMTDVPTIEERTRQRMRGAGTHAIQKTLVAFPDASLSALSASMGEYEAGEEVVQDGEVFQDDPIQFDQIDNNSYSEGTIEGRGEAEIGRQPTRKETLESRSPSAALKQLPVEALIKLVKVPHRRQRINMAIVPTWLIPRATRSKAEQERAQRDFAEVKTLADSLVPGRSSGSSLINDADVTFTLIKREMAKYSNMAKGERYTELFERILARLFPLFRKLSEQASERQRLVQQLRDAHAKSRALQRAVYEKRTQVLRVRRTLEGIRREQESLEQRTKHESELSRFLSELQSMSSGRTS
jgi:hypothetical protein